MNFSKHWYRYLLLGFLLSLFTVSCKSRLDPDQPAHPSNILIYQVQGGGQGNNNKEFIQLFNDGNDLIDLQGWSLVYRLPTSEEDLVVANWETTTLIPPYGNFLLVREGQDFGITPDNFFNQALNTTGGGLGLLNPEGKLVDAVAWGKAPERFTEGTPAPALEDDHALVRQRGEKSRELLDSNDNFADFLLEPNPQPQNVTSINSPVQQHALQLRVISDAEVPPGGDFHYTIEVTNLGASEVNSLLVQLPILASLERIRLSPEWQQDGSQAIWQIDLLGPGVTITSQVEAQAPWIYGTLTLQNAYVLVEEAGEITLAPVLRTEVTGGVIPISIARTLIGQDVIVEGVATMYTGGFYAGSSGTKFYLDDGTAGVQIYVPSGMGVVEVPIGARVRVEGEAQLYRGALEIVPGTPAQVEVLELDSETEPPILRLDIRQVANDMEATPGKLVELQGTLVRAEEFSYSFELDFVDDQGQMVSAYIDKQTEATIENLIEGEVYRAIGIMEIRDGQNLLNPRRSSDLIRVFQPIVYLETDAPSAVTAGEAFIVTLSLENHTDQPLFNLTLQTEAPLTTFPILEIGAGGELEGGQMRWQVAELPADGGRAEVQYRLRMDPRAVYYELEAFQVDLPPGTEISAQVPRRVFNGGVVPIWAVQGSGGASPYRLDELTTTGVVTGAYPELEGFWIQALTFDDDPASSEGLFIFMGDFPVVVSPGDFIRVTGQVREISGQTQLHVASPDEIEVITRQNPLPAAVALDPPAEPDAASNYFEALEGMLVALDQTANVVGPTSRYGETFTVLAKHDLDRILLGEETGWLIVIDDGSSATHYDQATMTFAAAVGDQIESVYGPLAYTYGSFKIEPLAPPQIKPAEHVLPMLDILEPPDFSVMTWNVENLFDILEPHPTDPPRPRKVEYDLALTKIASTIVSAGAPTLIGLQEVENLKVLKDLAEHDLLASFTYSTVLLEGTDSRGIDVGYLVRTDQAEIVTYQQWPAPEGLTSRPPLMIHLRLLGGMETFEFYALNNHFTSLAGGVEATEPRRNEQALWNVEVMREIAVADPAARFIVMGDLNSFTDSLPIQSLREAGLMHAFDVDPERVWYSYVYQGTSQTLDHILMSPELFKVLADTVVLHTNADYPPPPAGDDTPFHRSDHDPVIAIFSP